MNWVLIYRLDSGTIQGQDVEAGSLAEALAKAILIRGNFNDGLIGAYLKDDGKIESHTDGIGNLQITFNQ